MTESQPEPVAPTNEALLEIIEQYHERIDRGESVDRDAFVAERPDHRDALLAYFDDLNVVEGLAGPTIESATEGTMITGETHSDAYAETMVQTSQSDTSNVRIAADAPRTQFGRYRLLKELGRGAMGAVYLAHDEQLDREIALKIPQFGSDMNPALLERFYREARAAAALRHPGICPVFDVGEIDGQHYITMAFIKGRPLRDFTKATKTQGIRQVVRVIRKLAMAMTEAHRHNVTHRDLKPANVMIDERKEPVVMDFGLARRAAEGEEKLTHSGTVIGTPAYMSPEQVDGDNDRVGPPADIYSLGVMFYEMLTGQLPFQGNLMSILKQIATDDPPPPTSIRSEVPHELEAVCLKMMARQIEDRYQSMEQVAVALSDFLKQKNAGTEESGVLETSKPPAVHPKVVPLVEATEPVTVPPAAPQVVVETSLPSITPDLSTTATRPPRRSSGGFGKRNLLIAGGFGGAALLLAGIVFIVQLGKVTVKITVDDPSLALKVDGDEVVIEGDGAPIRLSAGPHTLIVKRDGLEFEAKEFKVTKDGKNSIHVVVVGDEVQLLTDGKRPEARDGAGTQVVSALPPAAGPVDLKRGLVGHWNFEEGQETRVTDSSGNENHGTLKGATSDSARTRDAPPVPFAGKTCLTISSENQTIVVPTSPSVEITGDITISGWAKLLSRGKHAPEFLTKGGNDNYRLLLGGQFLLGSPDRKATLNHWGTTPAVGKWFHLLARYDGRTMTVYRDGRRIGEQLRSGPIVPSDRAVEVGSPDGDGTTFSLDDVRLYNRALSQAEIAVLAGKASVPNSGDSVEPITPMPVADASKVDLKRGLVGHWNFEEGEGTRVADSSGKSNHGTLKGSDLVSVWSTDVPPMSGAGTSSLAVSRLDQVVEIPRSPSLDVTGGLTISAWRKINSGLNLFDIVFKDSNSGYRLLANGTCGVGDKGIPRGLVTLNGASRFAAADKSWHHLLARCDGKKFAVFVDGALLSEADFTGPMRATRGPLLLAKQSGDEPMDVILDDVRLYNRALTEDEIAVLAGKAALPVSPGQD